MLLTIITAIVLLIVVLSVLVIIHELGHFLTARYFGIKVEEFGFGFPPRIWGIRRGETLYSINVFPIGGFVKLYGEDEAGGGKVGKMSKLPTKDLKRAFFTHPAWQRAIIVFAGVVMNLILAAVIFYGMLSLTGYKTQVPLISNYHFFGVNEFVLKGVIIGAVEPGSPARESGIASNSNVISVNGQGITSTREFVQIINKNKGKSISMTLYNLSNQKKYSVNVTPRKAVPKNQGSLGVEIGELPTSIAFLSYDTPVQKAFSGITFTGNMAAYTVDSFAALIAQAFEKHSFAPVSNNVAGPIGIGKVFGGVAQVPGLTDKIIYLLFVAGIISVSLAIMNVLPIPALDGGRLFFILFEIATGKKMKPEYEALIHTVGFAVLILLLVLVSIHDVTSVRLP